MANTRSDVMANRLEAPIVLENVGRVGGRTRKHRSVLTVAGTEAVSHYFPIGRFKATDRIFDLLVRHTDLGTTLTMDFGVTTAVDWVVADGVEKDIDALADGTDMAAAARNRTSIFGSGVAVGTHRIGQRLWEYAGDAEAPAAGTEYDIVAKIITSGTPIAGTVDVEIEYTAGD